MRGRFFVYFERRRFGEGNEVFSVRYEKQLFNIHESSLCINTFHIPYLSFEFCLEKEKPMTHSRLRTFNFVPVGRRDVCCLCVQHKKHDTYVGKTLMSHTLLNEGKSMEEHTNTQSYTHVRMMLKREKQFSGKMNKRLVLIFH